MSTISQTTIDFLRDLVANNNREWFQANKPRYEQAHKNMIEFNDHVLDLLQDEDRIRPTTGKKSLARIYRDTRFSKDKTPYKNHFRAGFQRDTVWLRGGYSYRVGPGVTAIAGGFFGPNKDDLLRIRNGIAENAQPLRDIVADKTFQSYFGEIRGDAVKSAPKGFSKEDPNIDLIRFKQFVVVRELEDEIITKDTFAKEIVKTFVAMHPFFDYMGEILTRHLKGEEA